MEIRKAKRSDRAEIVRLYQRSQAATLLPNPAIYPPNELGKLLYARKAIERYVAVMAGRIVGHGMIEEPNPEHMPVWRKGVNASKNVRLIELGGAFVDPALSGRGIWRSLLVYRLNDVRERGAVPVCGTWSQNKHVKRTLLQFGATEVGTQQTPAGEVTLFVF